MIIKWQRTLNLGFSNTQSELNLINIENVLCNLSKLEKIHDDMVLYDGDYIFVTHIDQNIVRVCIYTQMDALDTSATPK